jgi:hypothetical protein
MTVAATISSIMTHLGDILYGGVAGTPTRLPVGGANEVLHGGSIPAYSAIVEADIALANNTTNNVTVTKHGFCPSLSGTTNTFLRGDGSFAAPTASTVPNAYIVETISSDTSKIITHNFGAFPLVQVLDTATGAVLIPLSIVNNSLDDFTVTLAVTGNYTIIATLGAPQLNAYTTKSDNYTMEAGDYIIRQTVADKTITLLTAVGRAGKIVSIKNSSTGDIHVTGTGGETLEGVTTVDIPAGDCYDFFSNNTNWEAK